MKARGRLAEVEAAAPQRASIPLILLCVAAFLAPLIGGGVATEASPVEPSYAATMRALFNGIDLPILSHFALALLTCTAAAWVLASRRVVQVPMVWLLAPFLGVFGLATASVVFSAFPFLSLAAALEWLAYGMTFVATIAIVGRRQGPVTVLSSLFAGCTLLALLGIWEYLALTNDPSWRIFGTWQNPNALAGMLLIGFFAGLGLALRASRSTTMAACLAGSAVIGLALALTQSKGAYLAAGIGLLATFGLAMAWLGRDRMLALRSLGRLGIAMLALIGLLVAIRASHQGEAAGAVLSRVTQSQSTQDQSSGFRMLLWKGSLELIKHKPLGWGLGSYRFESARPGLTTQTHLAHNSYLQLGVEAGVCAPLLLLVGGFVWLAYHFKGARGQDASVLALKIGVVAAIVAAAAHSFVDSDLHYFGSGFAFFLMLGVGIQLCVDGGSPESLQPSARWAAFAVAVVAPLGLLYFGIVEATKAHIRWHLVRNEHDAARAGAEELGQAAGGDGEGWYMRALVEPDPMKRGIYFRQAADRMPTTRNYRMLARAEEERGRITEAAGALNLALQLDPNNLLALKLLLDLYIRSKNGAMAQSTAERLLAVESKSYFQVRALPDMVPTETYFARQHLAQSAPTPGKKIELLSPAYDGLLEYAVRTVPNVAAAKNEGLPQGFAGETADDARLKLALAQEIARELIAAYESTSQPEKAADVQKRLGAVAAALASLG